VVYNHRYTVCIFRIDSLVKAFSVTSWGRPILIGRTVWWQIFAFLKWSTRGGERERERAEGERIGVYGVQTGHSGAANLSQPLQL
jgi:hypothetical protein